MENEERLYSNKQVANMMANAMDGYDKGYDKGRVRGKVDGIVQSLIGTAIAWGAVKVYQAYCAKKVKAYAEEQNQEKETVDCEYTEV